VFKVAASSVVVVSVKIGVGYRNREGDAAFGRLMVCGTIRYYQKLPDNPATSAFP